MNVTYGTRDITRNPALLKIDPNDSFLVEDKRAGKRLGVYLGIDLADEFLAYKKRKKMLESARKIKKDTRDQILQKRLEEYKNNPDLSVPITNDFWRENEERLTQSNKNQAI